MSLEASVKYGTVQGLGGLAIGTFCEYLFQSDGEMDEVESATQTIGQLLANALLATLFYRGVSKYIGTEDDPTKGAAFVIALGASQPSLMGRLKQLGDFGKSKFVKSRPSVGVGKKKTSEIINIHLDTPQQAVLSGMDD
jgi:hypothetical protein